MHEEIAAKLAIHQLEGVRFLNSQLLEYPGIFLNDESGLGKCFQIVALLSETAVGERPSLILCPNRERLHHWMYHLDVLCPALRSRVHPKSQLDVANELTVLKGTDWQYAIVDETRGYMTALELARLRRLAVRKYIFLSSRDLLDELMVLSDRLEFSCDSSSAVALQSMIGLKGKPRTKRASFRIYLCTRRFILRRNVRNYRRHLPLIKKSEFLESYNAWKVANEIEEFEKRDNTQRLPYGHKRRAMPQSQESAFFSDNKKTMIPGAASSVQQNTDFSCEVFTATQDAATIHASPSNTITAAPLHFTESEPLFDLNETNTEEMPPLRVDGDTPSEAGSIPEGGINIPETVDDSEGYAQFGQQISGGSTSTQPVLADERYRFPVEKFLPHHAVPKHSSSSLSGESLPNAQPPPPLVTISSSDSPPRGKSPALFEDTDNDTASLNSSDDDISLMQLLAKSGSKSVPVGDAVSPKTATERRQPSFSTPIAKLLFGPLAGLDGTLQPELELSSVDMFAESPIATAIAPRDRDNVFEITKNNAFANRIVVRGKHEGKLSLRVESDSSDDDVQFVDETVNVIDLDEAPGTPKSRERNSTLRKQCTPPSVGSNAGVSPGRGWLGKSLRPSSMSPGSNGSTPTNRRHSPGNGASGSTLTRGGVHLVRDAGRRRKLEELFKDVDTRRSDLAKRGRERGHTASRR